MKPTGITRKVDELGRIVLPIELRRSMNIAERDELMIHMEGDRIILEKFEPVCVFCNSPHDLMDFCKKSVCRDCARKLSKT